MKTVKQVNKRNGNVWKLNMEVEYKGQSAFFKITKNDVVIESKYLIGIFAQDNMEKVFNRYVREDRAK